MGGGTVRGATEAAILRNAMKESGVEPISSISFSEVLSPYIGVLLVAWLVTILATPVMRFIAVRQGIVDCPDQHRKNHVEPVAYLGGMAIFLGWLAGILICRWITPHLPDRFEIQQVAFEPSIIVGAVIITFVGFCDDVYGITPRIKVAGQLFAAAMVASTDLGTTLMQSVLKALSIPDPILYGEFGLSYVLGAAVIALFVLGACNAVNLLDGLDGLVAGVLAISCIGFLILACYAAINVSNNGAASPAEMRVDSMRVVMCLAMLGALLGFLPHNFNPANIFMGDTGSLLLGYLCATTILLFAHSPTLEDRVSNEGHVLVTAALIVFALPITDTALAIFRRVMARQPIYKGDDRHLHHQFVSAFRNMGCRSGLSVKLAVGSMYLLSLLFAVLGCLLVLVRWRFLIAVFAVIFGFVLVTGYKAGRRQALKTKPASGVGSEKANPEISGPMATPKPVESSEAAANR